MICSPTFNGFPKLRRYVEVDMPAVADVGAIARAFHRHTGYTRDRLAAFLGPDNPPVLHVQVILPFVGSVTQAFEPTYMALPLGLALAFEQGRDYGQARAGRVHLAGATLLTLLVGWAVWPQADDARRAEIIGDACIAFLRDVYGGDLQRQIEELAYVS